MADPTPVPIATRGPRAFGLDLGAWRAALARPWRGASDWPVAAWLAPVRPVRVVRADAPDAHWHGARAQRARPPATASDMVAVALPDALVLRREVVLPASAASEVASALAWQAQALNPFAPADLAWGWRRRPGAEDTVRADIVLASRKQVAAHLESLGARIGQGASPEAWVCPDGGAPVVLPGFGDGRRAAAERRARRLCGGLLALALLLAALLALTPSLQLRLRAADAARRHAELAGQARPVLARREALMQANEAMGRLSAILQERINPLRVLEVLTRELPDGTALQGFRMQGDTVTISGVTDDAASLMRRLGQQPGLREVRAPAPAMRQAGAAFETFTIAFRVDPGKFSAGGEGSK
jgi:general secretion pathway protein L